MSRSDDFIDYWRTEVKYSASNPQSFEERWSFVSSRMRIISLMTLSVLAIAVFCTYLVVWGPLSGYFLEKERTIERIALEDQMREIEKLEEDVVFQETYISNLQAVILGQIPADEVMNKKNLKPIDLKALDVKETDDELALSANIKEEMRAGENSTKGASSTLSAPINGMISQAFDKSKHPALDIVAKKDEVVKACQSGIVVYSGYSKKDGYFTILAHANNLISIYKHHKVNLKTAGQRIRMGDPIGIVGNSGENTTGPHLHFELWQDLRPLDPTTLISFSNN
jgi:murein DD-endopeptidase MepM/ murein hydrolase activator NlpD